MNKNYSISCENDIITFTDKLQTVSFDRRDLIEIMKMMVMSKKEIEIVYDGYIMHANKDDDPILFIYKDDENGGIYFEIIIAEVLTYLIVNDLLDMVE